MNLLKSFMNQKVSITFTDNTLLDEVVIKKIDSLFFVLECCENKIYSINSVKSVELIKSVKSEKKSEPVDYSALVDKLPEFPDN